MGFKKKSSIEEISEPRQINLLNEAEEEKEFILKGHKKIVPIGGRKAKVKDKDLDVRRNKLFGIYILRAFILLMVLSLFGIAIKNAFFPENVYTKQDIQNMIVQHSDNKGFPIERGRAYAQEYLYNYLNNTDSSASKQMMNVLNGSDVGQFNGKQLTDEKTKQVPAGQPILFREKIINDYSAAYDFSVYMTDKDGNTETEKSELTGTWKSFELNVYYDKTTQKVTLVGTPSIIPTYAIANASSLPREGVIGNGDTNTSIAPKMEPTIMGFIKAFSKVTQDSHAEIDQYIPSNAPVDLIAGFGGSVSIENNNAVSYKIYNTDTQGEYKVDANITWKDTDGVSFTGRYIITIKATTDGKFLVTKFAPYLFVKG